MYTLRVDCTPSLHTLVYDVTKQVEKKKFPKSRLGSRPLDLSSVHFVNSCRYAVQRRGRRESLCTTAGTRGTTGRVCAMHRGRKVPCKNHENKEVRRTRFPCFVHCRISKLGSGSDFEAYFIRLGIAAGRARYTKNRVRQHTRPHLRVTTQLSR